MRRWLPLAVLAAVAIAVARARWLVEEGEPVAFSTPRSVHVAPPDLFEGELRLGGVVVAADGSPVREVLVEVVQSRRLHWTYTDAEGRFALEGLAGGAVEVALVAIGHAPATRTIELPCPGVRWTLEAADPELGILPEVRRSTLAGRVEGERRGGAGGCEVVLVPAAGTDPLSGVVEVRLRVDGAGGFEAPELAHGSYVARVLPPWARGGRWPVLGERRVEHPEGGEPVVVELEAGAVRGELVDGDGEPVRGALVSVSAADAPDRSWPPRASGPGGEFEVGDLPAGRYSVRVRAGGASVERAVEVIAGASVRVDVGALEL